MRIIPTALVCISFVGCGGDDGSSVDAPTVPAMITVTGTATKRQGAGAPTPAADVLVGAYRNGNDATPVVTAMTDASGNYTLVIQTNGQALDGYIKGTLATFLDT